MTSLGAASAASHSAMSGIIETEVPAEVSEMAAGGHCCVEGGHRITATREGN